MVGGVLEILGLVALLIGVCELAARLFPRRRAPRPEPELVQRLRERGL